MYLAEGITAAVVVLLVVITVMRSVRIIPQARARNVERFGRYRKTLEPGMNFIIPGIDRVKKEIDLREQVVSFTGAPVITEDNLSVLIDTVLFFQVTDPRAADYEIVNYIQAIEQLTATMLRSVIGSMDLEQTLTSRDNAQLRTFPADLVAAARTTASDVLGELAAKSDRARKVYDSYTAFRDKISAWSHISIQAVLEARAG